MLVRENKRVGAQGQMDSANWPIRACALLLVCDTYSVSFCSASVRTSPQPLRNSSNFFSSSKRSSSSINGFWHKSFTSSITRSISGCFRSIFLIVPCKKNYLVFQHLVIFIPPPVSTVQGLLTGDSLISKIYIVPKRLTNIQVSPL